MRVSDGNNIWVFEYSNSNSSNVNNSNIRIFEYSNIRISVFDATIQYVTKIIRLNFGATQNVL